LGLWGRWRSNACAIVARWSRVPDGHAFSDLARMTQLREGANAAASMWLICGHKVGRSGAGVEPTEPWVTRPHWF
jgi:hypothetical protein